MKVVQFVRADGLTLSEYTAFATDLKTIYHAPTEEQARAALDRVNEKWTTKYPNSMKR